MILVRKKVIFLKKLIQNRLKCNTYQATYLYQTKHYYKLCDILFTRDKAYPVASYRARLSTSLCHIANEVNSKLTNENNLSYRQLTNFDLEI